MNHREQIAWQKQVISEEWTESMRNAEEMPLFDEEMIDTLLSKKPETLRKRGYLRLTIEH